MADPKHLVLILGAGASKPYGFPTGARLRELIIQGNEHTFELAARDVGSKAIADFVTSFKRSGHSTIDAYLEDRPESERIGKALIATVLAQFERDDSLYDPLEDDRRWYPELFNAMLGGLKSSDRRGHYGVSVLTFNYDRSLDYWLLRSVAERRKCSAEAARQALVGLPVVHLHGTLGGSPLADDDAREYGAIMSAQDLWRSADEIRVIHEAMPTGSDWERAYEELRKATDIVFLGFGYNERNITRLRLSELCAHQPNAFDEEDEADGLVLIGPSYKARVLGSCFGLTESTVTNEVLELLPLADSQALVDSIGDDVLGWIQNNRDVLKRERS